MPITDAQLDAAAQAWRDYAAGRPDEIEPRLLLRQRDLKMYRGLGINTTQPLAERPGGRPVSGYHGNDNGVFTRTGT